MKALVRFLIPVFVILAISNCGVRVPLANAHVPTGVEAQNGFSQVKALTNYGESEADSWATVRTVFGPPSVFGENKPASGYSLLSYSFSGCSAEFMVGPTGRIGTCIIKT
jgi:hypothetical protein